MNNLCAYKNIICTFSLVTMNNILDSSDRESAFKEHVCVKNFFFYGSATRGHFERGVSRRSLTGDDLLSGHMCKDVMIQCLSGDITGRQSSSLFNHRRKTLHS